MLALVKWIKRLQMKVRGPNPSFTDYFNGRWQLDATRLVTTPDHVRPRGLLPLQVPVRVAGNPSHVVGPNGHGACSIHYTNASSLLKNLCAATRYIGPMNEPLRITWIECNVPVPPDLAQYCLPIPWEIV